MLEVLDRVWLSLKDLVIIVLSFSILGIIIYSVEDSSLFSEGLLTSWRLACNDAVLLDVAVLDRVEELGRKDGLSKVGALELKVEYSAILE